MKSLFNNNHKWIFLVFICLFFITQTSLGQSITPIVIASSGDYYESETYSLSLTMGEPVIDTYLGSADTLLTCGFQQGDYFTRLTMEWTGTIDDDWSKPGNWNFTRVPNSLDDVVIPGTAVHMPVVKIQGHTCRSIEIKQNASILISNGILLEVKGKIGMRRN